MLALTAAMRQQLEDRLGAAWHAAGLAHVKEAGVAVPVQNLTGRLYVSESGWGLLSVPNALVRGLFDALDEPGAELPLKDGKLVAHISVFSPEDLAQLGGPAKLSERGHAFRYGLGPVKKVRPTNWDSIGVVWYCTVVSRELEELRKSYGLSGKPRDGRFDFHITFARRQKHVLFDNDVKKAT